MNYAVNKSAAAYEAALGMMPGHWMSYNDLAEVYMKAGRIDDQRRTANCNTNANFSRIFRLKMIHDLEFSLKDDGFLLKNGRLFCNSRYR